MKNKIFLFIVFGAFGFAVFTLYTNVRKAKSELSNYSFYASEKVQPTAVFTTSASKKRAKSVSNSSDAYIVADNSVTSAARPISKSTASNSTGWQSANSGSANISRVNKGKSIQELSSSNNSIIIGTSSKSRTTVSNLAVSSNGMSGKNLVSSSFNKEMANSEDLIANGTNDMPDPGTDPTNPIPLGEGEWILISMIFIYTMFLVKKK